MSSFSEATRAKDKIEKPLISEDEKKPHNIPLQDRETTLALDRIIENPPAKEEEARMKFSTGSLSPTDVIVTTLSIKVEDGHK